MALLPIKIPPGFYRNATQYEAKNRWYDGSLVRFSEGRIRPIGGWQRLAPTQIVKRGAINALTISNGGALYSGSGTLTATGGGGSSFSGTYTVSGGVINAVAIVAQGADYTSAPTIVIAPNSGSAGSGAVITPAFHTGADPIRGLHSWRLSNGARYLAVGSTQSLHIWDGSQVVGANAPLFNATPYSVPNSGVNFKDQNDFAIPGMGYGALEYGGDRNLDGSGGTANGGDVYGTPRYPSNDDSVLDINAFRDNFASVWSFDNMGDDLLAVNSGEGTIWHWAVATGGTTHQTFTASSDAGLLITTATGHGLVDTNIVEVSSLGVLPTNLLVHTNYYVRDITATTFRLALGSGGTPIVWADAGSGTHTWQYRNAGAVVFDNTTQTVSPPVPLDGAPSTNVAVVVTPERHILVLGADGDKRLIKWANQESLTGTANWAPSLVNTAGDITLQTKGRIVGGFKTRYGVLIFTTSDVWRTNYLGPPYVYGVERLTEGAGPIGMKCVAGSADFVAWMSRGRFWSYTGGYIKELNSDCGDYVFSNINLDIEGLVAAGHNPEFGEITWFYPQEGQSFCTRYITYSYREDHWVTGNLERSQWESSDALGYPVASGVDGYLYRHEMDPDTSATPVVRGSSVSAPADVSALSTLVNRVIAKGISTTLHPNVATENHLCFAETGAIEIGKGDQMMNVNQILTDSDAGSNGLRMKMTTASTPDESGETQGPFSLESDGYTDCRFTDRQAFLRIEAPFDQEFRFGEVRLNVTASGKR